MSKLFLSASALLLAGVSAQAQAQVVNGGFEAPVVGNTCCDTVVVPDSFPGWTVTAGDINIVNGTFSSTAGNLAFEGSQYLDLVGQSGAGAIEQTLATIAGQTYELTFAYSHNLFSGLASASANVTVAGLSQDFTHTGGSNADLNWLLFTNRFTATGTSTVLSFTNLTGGGNDGVFLDAVAIAAVPEPATWAMMIGGMGVIGGSLRRRKAALAAA